MSKLFFFDTETTGVPLDYKARVTNLENWPRLVQIAWIIYDENKEISCNDYIIKPSGFKIPKEASAIHGISDEIANEKGWDLDYVLSKVALDLRKCDALVAHNIQFDKNILGSEMYRMHKPLNFLEMKKICTMNSSTSFCKIPGQRGGYKWPKLEELHQILFGKKFDNAHDALADIRATANCFFELKKKGIINE